MTNHDYLVLGMAAVLLATNFLGAAFTIGRVYSQRKEHEYSSLWIRHQQDDGISSLWVNRAFIISEISSIAHVVARAVTKFIAQNED